MINNFDDDYDSDNSVIDSINNYIENYSSKEHSNNNSYKSSFGEKCIEKQRLNTYENLVKVKDSLNILNDELKLKLLCTQINFFNFIYKQVLNELKLKFSLEKQYKFYYKSVLRELITRREIYFFGKCYLNMIKKL
jgi:hypothetical protein